jgi:hypothetical protein
MAQSPHSPASQRAKDIAGFRLRRHHLLEAHACDAVKLAGDVCGLQAQLMAAAVLQAWTRQHGITRAEIESSLWQKRSLIKTSLMRQTLHLVPADELPLYIAALKSSRISAVLRIMSRFKISVAEADDLTGLIVDTLSGGPLGRAAIMAAVRPKVSRRVRAWMDKVWSIVRIPIFEGLVCYGPGENNETTFIRVEQWLGNRIPSVPEEQARMALLRRYLRTYGPATIKDFAHWSGMRAAEVRPLPERLRDELAEVEIAGNQCLLLRDDLKNLREGTPAQISVRLLPHFDPYLLAHREKDHLVEARHYKLVYRNQGWISPVVLVSGSIAGVWQYKKQGKKLQVTIEPFGKLSRQVRSAIGREAECLADFYDCTLELVVR